MPPPRLPDALVLPKFGRLFMLLRGSGGEGKILEVTVFALGLSDRVAYRNEQILKEEKEVTA